MIYEKCRDILLQECELIQGAVAVQEKIRAAVSEREWTDFDTHLNAMNSIENKMVNLESERENLFLVFKSLIHEKSFCENLDDKGQFKELVSLLPKNQRDELNEIYRSLKMESLKLRISNDALMTYISGVKSTLQEFFELAFPERGGKMYTKDGTHFSNDMRCMVLNRSF
ncbi:MAG: hypothetical protein FWB95_01125 [Treponema sp.]|nr:hypothetical protein [Treponema sp.]